MNLFMLTGNEHTLVYGFTIIRFDPMRWVNRLLYNNDKLKPIASLGRFKVTSVQAIGEERLIHF